MIVPGTLMKEALCLVDDMNDIYPKYLKYITYLCMKPKLGIRKRYIQTELCFFFNICTLRLVVYEARISTSKIGSGRS